MRRDPHIEAVRELNRYSLKLALAEAIKVSKMEPHKIFYVTAVRCPSCRKHAAGILIAFTDSKNARSPKYRIATIMAGDVIPARQLRH